MPAKAIVRPPLNASGDGSVLYNFAPMVRRPLGALSVLADGD
jgi:hypothetical protein